APPARCAGAPCEGDAECEAGQAARSKAPKNFVTLGVEQDLTRLSEVNTCTPSSQVNLGYSCFRADGSQYQGNPAGGVDDAVQGFAAGTTRVHVGFDRALLDNLTLGLRVGYALRGAPTGKGPASLPVNAEGRLMYWFGDRPFASAGLHPMALVGGGLGQ